MSHPQKMCNIVFVQIRHSLKYFYLYFFPSAAELGAHILSVPLESANLFQEVNVIKWKSIVSQLLSCFYIFKKKSKTEAETFACLKNNN